MAKYTHFCEDLCLKPFNFGSFWYILNKSSSELLFKMKLFHNNFKFCKNLNNEFRQMSNFLGVGVNNLV